jgi:hypothetical protein
MRQARLGWAACAAAGLACFAGPAGSAVAQGSEVFVDPDSPAGKEYALPLEAARQDAARGSPRRTGSERAPPFGAGISRRGPGTRSRHSSTGADERRDGAEDRPSRPAASAVGEDGAGLPAGLLTALIALGVLTVGGAIGLSFRALRPADGQR